MENIVVAFDYCKCWIVLLVLVALEVVQSANQKKNNKKAKVMACLALSNERVNQDKETFAKMAGKMDDKLGGQDYLGRMHEMLLINCYQEITEPLTERILKEMRTKKLNIYDKDYQQLLMPKQLDPSKTDIKKYQESAAEIKKYIDEIKADEDKRKKGSTSKDKEKGPAKKADPNAKWEYDQYENEVTWKDLLSIKKLIYYTGLDTYCGITIATLIILIIIKKKNQKGFTKKRSQAEVEPQSAKQ